MSPVLESLSGLFEKSKIKWCKYHISIHKYCIKVKHFFLAQNSPHPQKKKQRQESLSQV